MIITIYRDDRLLRCLDVLRSLGVSEEDIEEGVEKLVDSKSKSVTFNID